MERFVSFLIVFALLFGLGALLKIVCSSWTWGLIAIVSATLAYVLAGLIVICHDCMEA